MTPLGDPFEVTMAMAREHGDAVRVRAKQPADEEWREFSGTEFVRWATQLSQGFNEVVEIDQAWRIDA